jgi:hypothetical protein
VPAAFSDAPIKAGDTLPKSALAAVFRGMDFQFHAGSGALSARDLRQKALILESSFRFAGEQQLRDRMHEDDSALLPLPEKN